MSSIARAAVLALAVLTLVAARAEEPARPPHAAAVAGPHAGAVAAPRACLNQKERRAAIESGTLVRLDTAIHAAKKRMPGTVVRARLCHGDDGLVYVLTMLAHDGKVARLTVDATKGTLIGQR